MTRYINLKLSETEARALDHALGNTMDFQDVFENVILSPAERKAAERGRDKILSQLGNLANPFGKRKK